MGAKSMGAKSMEAKSMENFNKNTTLPCDTTCPKCGSEDINRTYSKKGDYRGSLYYKSIFENEYIKLEGYRTLIKKECIFNHCRICHYEWAVDVL